MTELGEFQLKYAKTEYSGDLDGVVYNVAKSQPGFILLFCKDEARIR